MQPTKVTLGGKSYVMPTEPTIDMILKMRDWIAEQVGDPYADLALLVPLLPPEEGTALVMAAKAKKEQLRCFTLACPLAKQYMQSELGATQFAKIMLQDANPDLTDQEAFSIAMALGKEETKQKAAAEAKQKAAAEKNGLTPTENVSLVGTNI